MELNGIFNGIMIGLKALITLRIFYPLKQEVKLKCQFALYVISFRYLRHSLAKEWHRWLIVGFNFYLMNNYFINL